MNVSASASCFLILRPVSYRPLLVDLVDDGLDGRIFDGEIDDGECVQQLRRDRGRFEARDAQGQTSVFLFDDFGFVRKVEVVRLTRSTPSVSA